VKEASGVTIEPIDQRHTETVQQFCSDPAIGKMSQVPSPYPPDGAEVWIRDTLARRMRGTEYAFAIRNAEADFVGVCTLMEVSRLKKTAVFGYWIAKPFWNRGYATAGARQVLRYGFERLGVQKVHASCMDRNAASYRVLLKMGFRFVKSTPTHKPGWSPLEKTSVFELCRKDFEAAAKASAP